MAMLVDQDDLPQDKQEVASTDQEQPTLSEILRTVNTCMASVNTLKDHLGGEKRRILC